MSNDKLYNYQDCYMYFTFNGVHSSQYNLFIQNKNNLKFINTISGSNNYTNALFQDGSYYLGTSKNQKTFKYTCAAGGLSLGQYKDMMLWLTTGSTGFLSFDFDPYWGWDVVLENVGDATYMDRNGQLVVEFELTWKTIGSYFAHNIYPAYLSLSSTQYVNDEVNISKCNGTYNATMLNNEYKIPTIYCVVDNNTEPTTTKIYCYVQGVNNMYQYLDFSYVTTKGGALQLTHKSDVYINLVTKKSSNNSDLIEYFGESNLVLGNGQIIEMCDDLFISNYQGMGSMKLQSLPPQKVAYVIQGEYLILDASVSIYQWPLKYNSLCFSKKIGNANTAYNGIWGKSIIDEVYDTKLYLSENDADAGSLGVAQVTSFYSPITSTVQFVPNVGGIISSTTQEYITSNFNTSSIDCVILKLSNGSWEDINQNDYTCFLTKTNIVTLTATELNEDNEYNASIQVTSYNNL